MTTTDRLRRLGSAIRWRALVPALVVLAVALGVTVVLLDGPETPTSGNAGRGGQYGGTVATSVARTTNITEAVRLSGTVAATTSAAVVSAMAGKVDKLYVDLGDEVRAGATIAHLAAAGNTPAAYRPPAPASGSGTVVAAAWTGEAAPTCGSPPPGPGTSPPSSPAPPRPTATSPSPSRPPRPNGTPSRGNTTPARPGGAAVPDININPPDININPPDINIDPPDIKLPGGGLTEQTVTAPFAGKITALTVVEGSPVSAGTVLVTVSGDGLEARAAASPTQAAQLAGHTGAAATVRSAVPGGATTSAVLSSIAPTANAATQQTAVVVNLSDAAGPWKPGDPVVVDVGWPDGKGVVVPPDAVVYADGKPAVFVVTDQIDPTRLGINLPANLPPGLLVGRVKLTPVELGGRNGGSQEVEKGLADGAVVVTRGQTNLIDGVRVAILDSSSSPSPKPSASPTGTR
jgi:multidrug efflux pump subunit AcrA (membrane-fusion protein)